MSREDWKEFWPIVKKLVIELGILLGIYVLFLWGINKIYNHDKEISEKLDSKVDKFREWRKCCKDRTITIRSDEDEDESFLD